ncbi:hypothetical protein A3K93_10950 [Acinetobacter sp. NCu2D-2]|uniref:pilus assembly FimT family protein n=1 Tax=Acinetobacter sp. NCu2D-2 TaxID=1608473 RepID=UPI0007CDDFFD|nr:GspH/FimT family pseudopilin [Acinetobacter sp. NCu2D-2]ANF83171.1 hypothetical protein A3K93_10950 [Acinetobacter sp. NCu2D-2]
MRRKSGFTLVELMVTIAVVAIVAVMAAPSFGTMLDRQNLNKSSTELVNILAQARSKAALDRREISVNIGTAGTDDDETLHWIPSGKATLQSTPTVITFMPNGMVQDPATLRVITTTTTFEVCDRADDPTTSKIISISRMGTMILDSIVDNRSL